MGRSRTAVFATAVVALLTTLGAGATPHRVVSVAGRRSSAPAGLITGLKDLDTQLDGVIKKVGSGDLKGQHLIDAVQSLNHKFEHLLITHFPKVFDLSFALVFAGFTNIDADLNDARVLSKAGKTREAARAIDFEAKSAQEGLTSALTSDSAKGVPSGLLDGLHALGHNLETTGRKARSGDLKGTALAGAINTLASEKRDLIKRYLQGVLIFGQPFNVIFRMLETVELKFREVMLGVPEGHHFETSKPVLERLRDARDSKESFEATVVHPPVSPIKATFYMRGTTGCENDVTHPNYGETCYVVTVPTQVGASKSFSHDWGVIPPLQDPNCKLFSDLRDPPEEFLAVWHHGDEDGCHHELQVAGVGHVGVVWFEYDNPYWQCVDTFYGTDTNTDPGGPPVVCFPRAGTNVLTVVKATAGPGGAGNGTITSSPAGISCDTTCKAASATFPEGEGATVTLTVAPDGSSKFMGWSGDGCTGTGTCTVTLSKNTVVMATFQSS